LKRIATVKEYIIGLDMFEKNPSVQIYTITIKKIEEKSFCYFPPCNEKDANGCTK